MAHYAELDANNIVTRVIVVDNAHETTESGQTDEALGVAWCVAFTGGGTWKKTSYNDNIRKNYAGIGYIYDATRNAFIAPQPGPSYALGEQTCRWECLQVRSFDSLR